MLLATETETEMVALDQPSRYWSRKLATNEMSEDESVILTGTVRAIRMRTSGATMVDVDDVAETVGDGVAPGAETVVDAVGELVADARFVGELDG